MMKIGTGGLAVDRSMAAVYLTLGACHIGFIRRFNIHKAGICTLLKC